MKSKIIVMFVFISFFSLQASDDSYAVGEKRTRISFNNRRVKPKIMSLKEELEMHINEGDIVNAIDILDDIALEGYLNPNIVDEISNYVSYRNSVSPIQGYFQPIQDHLDWLVYLNYQ